MGSDDKCMKEKRFPGGTKIKIDSDVAERLKAALSKKYVTRIGILGTKTNRLRQDKNESHKAFKKRVRKWLKERSGGSAGEMTNAEIGLLHEKGSLTRNIPRRSFLEVPLVQNIRQVDRMGKVIRGTLEKAIKQGEDPEKAWYEAHRKLGVIGEQIVQHAFEVRGPGWKPNHPITIAKKGSDSPLIDTAQLRRSIMSDVKEKTK